MSSLIGSLPLRRQSGLPIGLLGIQWFSSAAGSPVPVVELFTQWDSSSHWSPSNHLQLDLQPGPQLVAHQWNYSEHDCTGNLYYLTDLHQADRKLSPSWSHHALSRWLSVRPDPCLYPLVLPRPRATIFPYLVVVSQTSADLAVQVFNLLLRFRLTEEGILSTICCLQSFSAHCVSFNAADSDLIYRTVVLDSFQGISGINAATWFMSALLCWGAHSFTTLLRCQKSYTSMNWTWSFNFCCVLTGCCHCCVLDFSFVFYQQLCCCWPDHQQLDTVHQVWTVSNAFGHLDAYHIRVDTGTGLCSALTTSSKTGMASLTSIL